MFAIKIETTNDINGSPRRGWLVYDQPGVCVAFVQEYFGGDQDLWDAFADFSRPVVTAVLEVTPREYNRAKAVQKKREQE